MNTSIAAPLQLPCGVTLPNRLMKSAMTEGLADLAGNATAALETVYRRWSEGGAGLLVSGNVMVDRRYLERPGNLVVENRRGLAQLSALARAGRTSGNQLWMQISHPGRQCSRLSNNHPVAPSAVQLRLLGNFARPRPLTAAEIQHLVKAYSITAGIAREAGFTGVQVHGAHGYLVSQFLSPVTNHRADRWGGELRNRARFLLDIVAATRREVGPEFPISVKLNATDFQRGGFNLEESVQVAGWLQDSGIDLLEISGGNYEQPRLLGLGGQPAGSEQPESLPTAREAYFLDYAQAIRATTTLPLAVTGGIRSHDFMNDCLARGLTDVVGLARPLCMQPELPRLLLEGRADAGRRDETRLRLGPGLFGPHSPFRSVRALSAQGGAAWYYRQIIRLSQGIDPDPTLSFGTALRQHFIDEYRLGLARRRYLKKSSPAGAS